MRVLVIGYGSIGKRHAANIEALGHHVLIHDPPLGRQQRFKGFDAAVICSPPALHLKHVAKMARRAIPCLVEKPYCLPVEVDTARIQYANMLHAGLPVMVGHNIFWNETWRRFRDKIESPSVYIASWQNDLRRMLGVREDSYQRHAEHGGILLDCVQDVAIGLDAIGPAHDAHKMTGRAGTVTEDADDWALLSVAHHGGRAYWQFAYVAAERSRSHLVFCRGRKEEWNGGDRVASDASYQAEVSGFLEWVKTGHVPQIRPDPFAAIQVIHDAT